MPSKPKTKPKKTPKSKAVKVVSGGSSLRGKVRFSKLQMLIMAVIIAAIGISVYLFSSAATAIVPVYRVYSPLIPNHFFTTSLAEYNALPNYGYQKEGISFNAWSDGNDGRVPVYQITNNPNGGGQHLFTISAAEKDSLVAAGWKYDRIAFYAYSTAAADRSPVYRYVQKNSREHVLVLDGSEKTRLDAGGIWQLEGIAFYSSNQQPTTNVSVPVGAADVNSCSTIGGWAVDPDNTAAAVNIHVYIDGTLYDAGATNVSRPDVNKAQSATGNHGFNWAVPAKYRDGKPHMADVYAINVDSSGGINGDNPKISSAAWGCGSPTAVGSTAPVAVGTCVTSPTTIGACTKEAASQQAAFFNGLANAASCVGLDGVTMVRCTQDAHDKQVASGILFERGCLGQTLDGTNRIDCSSATKNAQEAFFNGLAAQQSASNARSSGSGSGSGGSSGDLDPAVANYLAQLAYAAGVNAIPRHSTAVFKECVAWYYNKTNGAYRRISLGYMAANECARTYQNAPSTSGDGAYNTYDKNHVDWPEGTQL